MTDRPAVNPPSWLLRVTVVSLVGAVVLAGSVSRVLSAGATGDELVFALIGPSVLTVGSLLVLRVPENRVSWVLLGVAFGFGLMSAFEGWASRELGEIVGGIALFGLVLPGLGVFVPLWFPTGDALTPGWRWVSWMGVAGVVGIVAGWAIVVLGAEGGDADIEACTSIGTCSSVIGLVLMLGAVIGAIVSLVVRWVRSTGVERLQMKWLVIAFFVFGIGVFAEFGGFQNSLVALILLPSGLILIPVTIGIAILRYRLYEIDRIVSRTVSYTLVVGFLAAVYVGGVTWLTSRLPDQSQLVVAATTLAVAALFNPLRKRVQGWVDRRFNRSRYDTQRVMDRFAGSLRDQVDSEEVVQGWVGVVSETMQPVSVAVWVRQR